MILLLAQTTAPAAAATQPAQLFAQPSLHVAWDKWASFYSWEIAAWSFGTLAAILLSGIVLTRIFRHPLERYRLVRPTRWAIFTVALYFAIVAAHPYLMVDRYDILALVIHRTFVAILLIVAVRYLDRLIILPLLTRISKSAPSRFVHQIIIFIVSIFVIAGYSSWAFGIEIGSFLAGSAVISIVLGLALQETLGNFFSGMVLQASVPFQPGDWIQIGDPGGVEGRVIEMTWRAVTLLTGANNHVLIPNSTVAKEKITNFHSPSVATATSVSVGLDYAIPPNDAKNVLLQAAKDVDGVLPTPEPSVALRSFDDSAITYSIFFWINQPQRHKAIEEMVRTNVWYRLDQANYGIPFPIRSVEFTDAEKKRAAAQNGSRAARLAAVKKSPLFADLAPDIQEKIAAETRDFALAAKQTFYRQDDPGDSLFILTEGAVTTTIRADDPAAPNTTRDIDAGDMTAPAIFGEISALTGQPRTATVRAKTNVRTIEIDQTHLKDLFTRDPALMEHFSNVVADRQKHRDQMLKNLGASTPASQETAHSASVLDRMKRLFTLGR